MSGGIREEPAGSFVARSLVLDGLYFFHVERFSEAKASERTLLLFPKRMTLRSYDRTMRIREPMKQHSLTIAQGSADQNKLKYIRCEVMLNRR